MYNFLFFYIVYHIIGAPRIFLRGKFIQPPRQTAFRQIISIDKECLWNQKSVSLYAAFLRTASL